MFAAFNAARTCGVFQIPIAAIACQIRQRWCSAVVESTYVAYDGRSVAAKIYQDAVFGVCIGDRRLEFRVAFAPTRGDRHKILISER